MTAGADPTALCEEILAEGRRRAEALLGEARRQGEALLEEAEREAARLRRDAEANARREAGRHAGRVRARLEIELRRLRADRVEEVLASLRERARQELDVLGAPAVREAICALAAEALRRMEGRAFVLAVGPGWSTSLGDELAEEVVRRAGVELVSLFLTEDPSIVGAGFVLRDSEGRQEWDGRLGARLDRAWPALRVGLARGAGLLPAAEGRAP